MAPDGMAPVLAGAAVVWAAAIMAGRVARKVGLPPLLGELIAGVLLGPTLLGRLWPEAEALLFPVTGAGAAQRQMLVTAGLLGFLFTAGLEMDLSPLSGRLRVVAGVSACGILVPFAVGALAVLAAPAFFGGVVPAPLLALFLGTALSISALPVIARTLMDLGLYGGAFAGLVLSVAVVDDLIGWALFAFLCRRASGGAVSDLAVSLTLVLALVVFSLTTGRRMVSRVRPRVREWLPDLPPRLALAAGLTFGAAALVESLGVHAVLGGFLAGVILSQGSRREDVHEICHAVGAGVLAPLYFTSIGLRADFVAHLDVALTLVVIAVACVGKIGAAAVAGRLLGLSGRDAMALGVALNARGAMEILLAGVALEQKLIDERLFVSLVVMAVATSLMAAPLLRTLVRRRAPAAAGPAPIPARAS